MAVGAGVVLTAADAVVGQTAGHTHFVVDPPA